ncbi:hypothetical protein [Actinokineospora iranica]|uniref:hypothetical protein n=1 Tax=Actinokineospora iranica TaxID=1271860 RepID=UPI00111376CB|nr:hypothetical protein [Actinokineospora iranica]
MGPNPDPKPAGKTGGGGTWRGGCGRWSFRGGGGPAAREGAGRDRCPAPGGDSVLGGPPCGSGRRGGPDSGARAGSAVRGEGGWAGDGSGGWAGGKGWARGV